jgi:hypothetical protein
MKIFLRVSKTTRDIQTIVEHYTFDDNDEASMVRIQCQTHTVDLTPDELTSVVKAIEAFMLIRLTPTHTRCRLYTYAGI